jgi:hypothetical protein
MHYYIIAVIRLTIEDTNKENQGQYFLIDGYLLFFNPVASHGRGRECSIR